MKHHYPYTYWLSGISGLVVGAIGASLQSFEILTVGYILAIASVTTNFLLMLRNGQ
jgi:hypothetical protein